MRRREKFFLPSIIVDRQSRVPLHRQVQVQFARGIRQSALEGERLPSTRGLARLLGVSRNTVLAAYDELVAEGLIDGRPGSGMRVRTGGECAAPFDSRRALREAQFPARAVGIADPDGTPLYLTY